MSPILISGGCLRRYFVPECHDDVVVQERAVFSFGLILHEHVVSRPAFPKRRTFAPVTRKIALEDWRPTIPDDVLPGVVDLILDCCGTGYSLN
jgi:hypothetical protein